jgi:hypothetical protein
MSDQRSLTHEGNTQRGISERLLEIADQFERDRKEPDKVLCAVQNLRRLAIDLEQGHEMVGAMREHRAGLNGNTSNQDWSVTR